MFKDLPVRRYTFLIRIKDRVSLPVFKGSTFRGGFGHAFKRVVCTIRNTACLSCILYRRCVYSCIFETPPPEGSEMLRKYRTIPHPFVLEPPPEKRTEFSHGEELTFNLILIGKAIDYLPYFIYTFEELGRIGIGRGQGNFELKQVSVSNADFILEKGRGEKDRSLEEAEKIIYTSETKTLKGNYKPILIKESFPRSTCSTSHITLNFITPTRMKTDGRLIAVPEFHHIIRSLLRRVSSLSYFHCGKRLNLDFKGLIERAEKVEQAERDLKWYDWERYSARQDVRMKLGGFTGSVAFKGNIGEFIPLLRIGEVVHIGKGTSFGLGKYEMITTL